MESRHGTMSPLVLSDRRFTLGIIRPRWYQSVEVSRRNVGREDDKNIRRGRGQAYFARDPELPALWKNIVVRQHRPRLGRAIIGNVGLSSRRQTFRSPSHASGGGRARNGSELLRGM